MRKFKGSLDVFFIIALAMLLLLGFGIAGIMHRASLVSYEERIDLAIILDNAGSGLLGLLNSGEAQARHMEIVGASAAKGQDFDTSLRESLESLKTGMMQTGYSLRVLVSGSEVKSYGTEPPEGATIVETDTPLPCKQGTECRGKLEAGTW
jgi:hypothetical protein